jgi:3-hydroxyacyl-[acyl-carrier-protein] dehydratase
MRFHLIDRLDAWEPARRVTGRKLTSVTEEFWRQTPGGPVMPPELVLEALCQAGTWLIMMSTGHRRRAALLTIDQVAFAGDVRPGDVVQLDGVIESWSDEVAVLGGTASVDGRVVMTASGIMCAMLEGERLDDPANTTRMADVLVRAGEGR